jgi:hypothetical protein
MPNGTPDFIGKDLEEFTENNPKDQKMNLCGRHCGTSNAKSTACCLNSSSVLLHNEG